MGETRNIYRILVGKAEEKRQLGRPRRRWVDNIRIDGGEIGWDGVDSSRQWLPLCSVFTIRFLVMNLNNGYSSASVARCLTLHS
jgi:hypothetical protein